MGMGQSHESHGFSVPGLESRDSNLPGLSHGFQSQSRLSRQISVPVPGLASHRCRDSVGLVSHGTVLAKISLHENLSHGNQSQSRQSHENDSQSQSRDSNPMGNQSNRPSLLWKVSNLYFLLILYSNWFLSIFINKHLHCVYCKENSKLTKRPKSDLDQFTPVSQSARWIQASTNLTNHRSERIMREYIWFQSPFFLVI